MKAALCIAALLWLSGCSSQQVYNSTQSWRVQDCEKLGSSDRDVCLKNARATYSENAKRGQQ